MIATLTRGTLPELRSTRATEQRCRELGTELFERAHAAEPRIWQRAWWERRMLEFTSADMRMQTQLFRFMEALPHMRDDADIARHLQEYLDADTLRDHLSLRFATMFRDPHGLFGRCVGGVVRQAAFQMAHSFITGTNTREAIAFAERLRDRCMAFTLDVLGEATISERSADTAGAVYLELIESLGAAAAQWPGVGLIDTGRRGPMPRANISIKLSALDPSFNPVDPEGVYRRVGGRLRPLLDRARELGVFVNIDMEQYRYRDLTLDFFKRLLSEPAYRDWPDIGIVVQAYLRDAEDDLRGLLDWVHERGTEIAIRLVKGAYWDTETTHAVRWNTAIPVWTRKWESDACYEQLTRIMLEHADAIRPAFASHNVRSLAHVMAVAEELGLTARDYELQMLAGMGDPLKTAVVGMGRCLRIYCPYGDLLKGMAYLIRRLLENTSNDSFLKQGFGERGAYDRLLANPAEAQPPSAVPPVRRYADTFEDEGMLEFTNAVNSSFGSAATRAQMDRALAAARSHLPRTCPLLIGGERVDSGPWIESHNPANPEEIIGRAVRGSAGHADRAVAAAHRALPQWSRTSPAQRADILRRAAELLEQRRFELAAWLVLEIGKTPQQADAEITESIDYCNYHAALVERMGLRPRRRNVPGEDNVLIYDPCGVCACITPWDFPMAMLAGMATAALGAGNTVVVKPSSKATVAAANLVDLLHAAGVPMDALNYVSGDGEAVGTHLAEHPDVHVVAFNGSRTAALAVAAAAAPIRPNQDHFKRTILDAGAKNAIIVDHDVDIDEAVAGVLESAFAFSGQKCTACSRVIVLADIHDAFCARLAESAQVMAIGSPEDPATVIGPVIDQAARQAIADYIAEGRTTATVLFEAAAERLPRAGHYVAPIILTDVDPRSRLAREEIFGPVLVVLRAADFDHALALANDGMYALTGGLYSRSPAHIERARWEFRVGNLYINRRITGSQVDVQPYGGMRLSGDGARLGGPDYLRQFCRPRTISENTLRHGLTGAADAETPQPAATTH
ncbi:MAG TPA: proline dehydrogenase family protein [Phycisphaerae bacterium]|nr:proline dehydrogenase family protein [Phycisphaerae bacterium]